MKTQGYRLTVTFLTPVLGSQPTREVATEFIAAKNGLALPKDEEETLPDALERGTTVFHKLADGQPILYDYHVRGVLKEAGKVLNGKVTGGVKNLRSKVEQTVFVSPRQIKLVLPADGEMDFLERPLRAETPRGPRVALARSEMLPEGTSFACGIETLPGEISTQVLVELLDYGFYVGIGQWRTGGYGRFRYELTTE